MMIRSVGNDSGDTRRGKREEEERKKQKDGSSACGVFSDWRVVAGRSGRVLVHGQGSEEAQGRHGTCWVGV